MRIWNDEAIMKHVWLIACMFFAGHAMADSSHDLVLLGSMPIPSWQTVPDPNIESVQDRLVTGPKGRRVSIFELMPKGQNDNNWRKRYWYVTFENVTKATNAVMKSNLQTFANECMSKVKFTEYKRPKAARLFVMFCGKLKAEPLGQVSMIWLGRTGSTLVRVSEEWRGKPYNFDATDSYFWEKADLRRAVQLLGTARLE